MFYLTGQVSYSTKGQLDREGILPGKILRW
jgi:hypothetical protein